MKKNSGITLIALVITIIILIILAGVTISAVFGENGLILRAQEAKFKTEVSGIKDLVEIKRLELEAANELKQSTQSLSAYLNSLGMPKYISSSKLVIDGKKKLAYNANGDFSSPQRQWLEDIGIFPAEEENARLETVIENRGGIDYLVLHLRFHDDNDAFRYVCEIVNTLMDLGMDILEMGEGYLEDFVLSQVNEFYHEEYADIEEVLQAISIRDFVDNQEGNEPGTFDYLIETMFQIEISLATQVLMNNPSIITSSPSISIATLEGFVGFLPPADTYTFYYTGIAGNLEVTAVVSADLNVEEELLSIIKSNDSNFFSQMNEIIVFLTASSPDLRISLLDQIAGTGVMMLEGMDDFWINMFLFTYIRSGYGELRITDPHNVTSVVDSSVWLVDGIIIDEASVKVHTEMGNMAVITLFEQGDWKFEVIIPGLVTDTIVISADDPIWD